MSNLQEKNQKESEISGKKQKRDTKFQPGQSGNPAGKPKGLKSFDTLFAEAIKKIAKEKKLNMKNPETEMVVKAVVEALKGNYSYFRDIMDRRYGKAQESVDLTSGGKTLPAPIIDLTIKKNGILHSNSNSQNKETDKKD